MQIVSLTAENIKKLKAVHIKPDGNVVMITGENRQGKSSVLDSIVYALKGSKEIDKMPIRKGETSAKVVLDLEEFTVERTFTEKNSYLTIKNKEGFRATSPQALLDKIVGRISFDPLSFINEQDEKKQRQIILDMVGVDLTDINEQIARIKVARTSINQTKTRLKVELEKYPEIDAPEKEIDVAALTKELEEARKHNQSIKDCESEVEKVRQQVGHMDSSIKALEKQIQELGIELETKKCNFEEANKMLMSMINEHTTMKVINTEEIYNQLLNAQAENKKYAHAQQRISLLKDLGTVENDYKEEGAKIEHLEQAKVQLLKGAQMPIEGLSVDDNGVTYNEFPLSQISDSEKLQVGMAVSMALNPKLRVLRITDGSLLDSKSLKFISEMVKDNNYQLWLEKIDESGQVGIVIEDGMVTAINGEKT